MALLTYADRVAETTTTTGTGTIQLGGAVDGKFRTFVAGAGSGNTVPYVMVHRTANEWEVGYGVVTSGAPDTLTRAGVYSSSNGGSAVSFSAGTKDVFLGLPAGKTVTFDDTTGAVTLSSLSSGAGTFTGPVLGPDGSVSAVSFGNDGDPNTGVYFPADNTLGLVTDGSERVRVNSSGNVGIGTASPASFGANYTSVDVRGADGGGLLFGNATDYGYLYSDSSTTSIASVTSKPLVFQTNGVERMRIDASGNLGLGVTPSAWQNTGSLDFVAMQLGNYGAFVSGRDGLSQIFVGANAYYDGTNWKYANTATASLYAQSAGEHTWSNAVSGTAGNTISFTERARITSGGYFKASNDGTYLGSTSPYHEQRSSAADQAINVISSTNASYVGPGLQIDITRNTTNNSFYAISYYNRDGGAYRFYVADSGNVTNTNNSYGAISDEKVKQDIVDAASQWDDLKAVRVRKFHYTNDPNGPLQIGVVAQELEVTSPGLIDESPDYEEVEIEVEVEKSRPVLDEAGEPVLDEDGNAVTETYTETETKTERQATGTVTKSVKYSVLYMKSIKALQEAMARIETLEARLAALEAK